MKKIIRPLILGLAGVGVGGGAAYGTLLVVGPAAPAAAAAEAEAEALAFVPAGKVLAPLVFPDGRLSGYVSFEVHLDVAADKAEWTAARLPLLLNAINMRTYRTPMAAGPDGLLPNLNVFRKTVDEAAKEAFGPGVVRRVALTRADPA